MKVAVPTRNGQVDDHFGHCEYYTIYTLDEGRVIYTETMKSPEGCGCKSGVAPILAQQGVSFLLAGSMGMGALNVLNQHGIEVIRGCHGEVSALINAFIDAQLRDSGVGCSSHEGCHNE